MDVVTWMLWHGCRDTDVVTWVRIWRLDHFEASYRNITVQESNCCISRSSTVAAAANQFVLETEKLSARKQKTPIADFSHDPIADSYHDPIADFRAISSLLNSLCFHFSGTIRIEIPKANDAKHRQMKGRRGRSAWEWSAWTSSERLPRDNFALAEAPQAGRLRSTCLETVNTRSQSFDFKQLRCGIIFCLLLQNLWSKNIHPPLQRCKAQVCIKGNAILAGKAVENRGDVTSVSHTIYRLEQESESISSPIIQMFVEIFAKNVKRCWFSSQPRFLIHEHQSRATLACEFW